MVNGLVNVNSGRVLPPKTYEYQKYESEVIVDGQKQKAGIEKFPDGRVKIVVSDGKDTKVINTDRKGLQKYLPQAVLYSEKPEIDSEKTKEQDKRMGIYSTIMRNLALASMMMRSNNQNQIIQDQINQDLINQQTMQMQDMMLQNQLQNQIMNDIAQRDVATAVQMTTPGMM